MTSLESNEDFEKWSKSKFFPEEEFIGMLNVIDGIDNIKTQTYKVSVYCFQP